MTEGPGTRGMYTDADSETDEVVQPTSGADELRRAAERGQSDTQTEPEGAQEPPD